MRIGAAAVYRTLLALLALLPAATGAPEQRIVALAPVEIWADAFDDPRGIAIEADGAVLVADRGAGTVVRITPDHTTTIVAGGLERPIGLIVDRDGRAIVAEERAGRVVRLESGRVPAPLVAGVEQPRWLALGDDGTLYISARRATRDADPEPDDESAEPETILALSPTGRLSLFADGLAHLQGLSVLHDALYAATQGRHGAAHVAGEILRLPIRPDGSAGTPTRLGPSDAIAKPLDLVRDRLGALYVSAKEVDVAEARARRAIAKLHPSGHVTPFASGLHEPQGVAIDAGGNLLVADGRAGRVIRFRAPLAPVVSVADAVSSTVLNVRGTAEAGARVDVFVNDAPTALSVIAAVSGTFGLDVHLQPDVENRLDVFATAHGGDGLTSPVTSAAVVHDAGPPAVSLVRPTGRFVRRTIDVEATATDPGSGIAALALAADGRPLAAAVTPAPPAPAARATASWDTTATPDGAHTLVATATDRAGNVGAATRVVIVDNTPPETVITGGPDGGIAETSATFTFTGTDNITLPGDLLFAWRIDGVAWSPFSAATAATLTGLAEGAHVFEVKARDQAENEDASPAARSFGVTLRPAISAVVPPSGPIGTLVTVTGTGFAPGPVTVSFNGVAAVVRTATATSITTTLPPGALTGPLTVTTPRGTDSRLFTVEATQDFALGAMPGAGPLLQGASTAFSLAVTSVGGRPFTGLAVLGVDPLPPGLTAAFTSPALTGGQRATLTVRAEPTAALGMTPLTVRATATTELGAVTRSASLAVTVLPGGRTALTGRIVFVDGTPIAGVRLELAGQRALTDAAGNFLVLDPPTGAQMLMIDANAAQPGLPIYAIEVALTVGRVTELAPLRITPPPPPERYVAIDNAVRDQVITDARFPGFALTLPAGVGITGWDGTPKSRIAIERLLPGDLAVPAPAFPTRSFYQVFFGTPMGGLPSAPLPIALPNDQDLDPGQKVEIWYYDAAPLPGVVAGWRLAGDATVSADGRAVVADPGVGLERFCGVCGVACINSKAEGQPNRNPSGPTAGEPIDLGTGAMIVDKTDVVIPGRMPLAVQRTYNPYDPFGRVAGFELTTGPGWALSYDVVLLEVGTSMRRLVLPGNARFQFAREPDGTFVNTSDPDFAGALLTAEANGAHRLRLKDGTAWRFAAGFIPRGKSQPIAGLGLLVEQRDRNDNTLTIARDTAGGITAVTEPAGRTLVFSTTLLANGDPTSARLTEVADPLGRTIRYGYDGSRRLATVTDPAGGVTRYTYDAAGGIVAITDPRGITFVVNEYDVQSRVVRQTQADGGVWTFGYEGVAGAHSRVTVTDPAGRPTVHRMTSTGFASETIDALGNVTRYERDASGNLVTLIDPLQRVTRLTYDRAGNVVTVTDPAGATTTYAYDPALAVTTSITDATGAVAARFDYDAVGNLIALIDPRGQRTTIARNTYGQPIAVTDPQGQSHRFEYDALGNVVALIDPLGNRLSRAYDAASRLVSQTDPVGRTTLFAYDRLNHLLQIVDPAGQVTAVGYDPNGNLTTVTDARGQTTTHTHDVMDRLETRTDPLGQRERFEYDRGGNLIGLHDRSGRVTTYTYDAADRRTATTYADGASTTFIYDAADRVVQAADSSGESVINRFDDAGHLVAQMTALGTVGYGYDLLARRVRVDLPAQPSVSYAYDDASRLTAMTQGSQMVGLDYDVAGRRTSLTLPNGVVTDYDYDAASQVIGVTYRNRAATIGTLRYAYDAVGRLSRASGDLARTLLPPAVTSAAYDGDNRQLAFGDKTPAYDPSGNMTSLVGLDGVRTYAWDARNRLVALDAPGVTASFGYDPLGRRTRTTINGVSTAYLYDGPNIVLEAGTGGEASYLTLPGLDMPVARDGAEFYLGDRLGSIVGLTDGTGRLTTRYVYDPFGASALDGDVTTNPFQFTARESDGTGLYYYRARYYAPALHRFVGQDLVNRLGANRYAYAGNDPVNAVDPFGLDTLLIYGALASSGPGGASAAFGGNIGLERINDRLVRQQEPVTVFNSGQQKDIVQRAVEAVRGGQPIFIVGHSLGGQRALAALRELQGLGITPNHVFTIDPFIADGVSVPPGVPVTNFYQMQSVINGRPIINGNNLLVAGPGVGHFSLTAHAVVVNTIVDTIVSSRSTPPVGGRY